MRPVLLVGAAAMAAGAVLPWAVLTCPGCYLPVERYDVGIDAAGPCWWTVSAGAALLALAAIASRGALRVAALSASLAAGLLLLGRFVGFALDYAPGYPGRFVGPGLGVIAIAAGIAALAAALALERRGAIPAARGGPPRSP